MEVRPAMDKRDVRVGDTIVFWTMGRDAGSDDAGSCGVSNAGGGGGGGGAEALDHQYAYGVAPTATIVATTILPSQPGWFLTITAPLGGVRRPDFG